MGEENAEIPVERKKVVHAVKIVKQLHTKWLEEAKKKPLLEDVPDTRLMLQVVLKKIPIRKKIDMIKLPLPHTLLTETSEVCLITGDLDKKDRKAEIEPTVEYYKDLLRKNDIKFISEVIPLRQLRTDYKPFEAKRQLVAAYDVFLADEKIISCLPKVLGKSFFKKRKFPQQVDLKRTNLKDYLEKSLSKAILFVTGHGNSCATEVARLGFPTKKTVDNVMAAIKAIEEKIPGSWANVHGLYVKTARSKAIPIYMSFEPGNDIQLEPKYIKENVQAEEISTLRKTKVKVYKSGKVHLMPVDEESGSESDSDYESKLLKTQYVKRKRINTFKRKQKRKALTSKKVIKKKAD